MYSFSGGEDNEIKETLRVSISGLAFSLLLYENINNNNSNSDQEGFLLGEINTTENSKVTDANLEELIVEKVVKVNSVLPCVRLCSFYNKAGLIDKVKLMQILGNDAKQVVAWYKFNKKTNSNKLTFREVILHKQLKGLFNEGSFCVCILTNSISANYSTHTFYQTFLHHHHRNDRFQNVPFQIINLSQKNDCYKQTNKQKLPNHHHHLFNKMLKNLEVNPENSQGVVCAMKIQETLQNYMDNLVSNLEDSEQEIFRLEYEIKQVNEKINKSKSYTTTIVDDCILINGTSDEDDTE